MSNSENNLRIDYVEFPATDIEATKRFYSQVFGWKFEDYGPDYTSFHDGRLAGGFTKVDLIPTGGPLVVIYATDLDSIQAKVREAGGNVEGEILEFPGGRRFHFLDHGCLSGRISQPRSERWLCTMRNNGASNGSIKGTMCFDGRLPGHPVLRTKPECY